jgi:hypothetical protein
MMAITIGISTKIRGTIAVSAMSIATDRSWNFPLRETHRSLISA